MIELDPRSRQTIYEQVVDKLRMLIVAGVIAPDEKLPSVRDLSKQLTVNPNTAQKAFSELERQGYIYTTAGVGTFASNPADIIPDEKLIVTSRLRLADDVREIRGLTGSARRTEKIVLETLVHIERGFSKASKKEKGER
jgi:GntR family transcriptional regulator